MIPANPRATGDVTVDPEVARRILARAAELDAREGVSLQQLGESASEAGISPIAFRAACAEVRAHSDGVDAGVYLTSEPWWIVGYRELAANPYVRQSMVAGAAVLLASLLLAVTGRLIP